MKQEINKRNSNIELLRIIMIILIISSHYVHNSGLIDFVFQNNIECKSFIILILGMWGKPIINGFVFITGYYMCKSKIKIEKAIKLCIELFFWNIIIYSIFVISGYEKISIFGIIYNVFPIRSFSTNYIPCFLLFYLLIPFINLFISNANQKQHGLLTLILLFLYSVLGNIPKIPIAMNYVSWFFVLYLLVSYCRFYYSELMNKRSLWLVVFFIAYITSAASIIFGYYVGLKLDNNGYVYYFLEDSNKILALVLGFSLFCIFLNINIPVSSVINWISKTTLGVLMIHANSDLMRKWLWKDTLKVVDFFDSRWWLLHFIISVIVVYFSCVLIESFRIVILDKIINNISRRIAGKIKSIFLI